MARPVAEQGVDADALRAWTATLIGDGAAKSAQFGIAVSGGADSLALLLLAHRAFPGRVAAATFDHQLREAGADEAAYVARLCADIGVPHTTLVPAEPITGSLQAAARTARYAALEEWRVAERLDWVMTAHHADDQLETLVMRLNRSSGVAGLSGVRARTGHVLRPLLSVRRSALAALVQSEGWAVIDDPSNRDDRFDRARVRKALAIGDLLDPAAAAVSVAALADADTALEWATQMAIESRVTRDAGRVSIDVAGLPRELKRRLICAGLSMIDPMRDAPRGEAIDRAMAALASGKAAMIGDTCLKSAKNTPDSWIFSRAAPRRIA
ncbi:MAG: tRNA lysidine(34) synthetase TilS [Sphingopyxis sp.]